MRVRNVVRVCEIFLWMTVCWAGAAFGQKPELVVQTGHINTIFSAVFSPDGKLLASASGDFTIKLWDVESGRELRTFSGHFKPVYQVAFSPDGKLLASGSVDKTIKLWNAEDGHELRTLEGHGDFVTSVALSPDGKTLASGSADSTLKLWDVASGRQLRTHGGHSGQFCSVVFSPDGKTLVDTGDNGTVRLWTIAGEGELRTLRGHTQYVSTVAFSSDGRTLASGSLDKTIKLWDVASGQQLRTLVGHTNSISSVAFSPDDKALASGGYDEKIRLWDVAGGLELYALEGHRHFVSTVVFSPDGKLIATASGDATIRLWDVANGRELRTFRGHTSYVYTMAFSPDGKTLVTGRRNYIELWDMAGGRLLRTLKGHRGRSVYKLVFSPDGKVLASGSDDSTVRLWEVESGRELHTLRGHASSLAFSPDGKLLASGNVNATVTLWDVLSGQQLLTFSGHTKLVTSLAFSADGSTLASGSQDKTIKLWDAVGGTLIQSYKSDDPQAIAAVSARVPDFYRLSDRVPTTAEGRWQVKVGENGQLNLHAAGTGRLGASLIALDEREWAVVTPDGLFNASVGAQQLMHYVVSTPEYGYEVITLAQLKERYYEPGLLPKLLGINKEPLRDIGAFREVKLYPAVTEVIRPGHSLARTTRTFRLTNHGGGIGRVQVFVNGREFIADARDSKLRRSPNVKEAFVNFDLKGAPVGIGQQPVVKVIAWNYDPVTREGFISSRGTELVYLPPQSAPATLPELWAVIGGVSDYDGAPLKLRYAGKDAVDFYRAVEVGGRRLFGVGRMHLSLLTTESDPRAVEPNKANFKRTFEEIARRAKPNDIFLVYLAGHGITLGRGTDTYIYLTKEARTSDTSVLSDGALRRQVSISSEELTEWHKAVPALKQVLILDTCAAGAAAARLVEKRELSSDAIRAIDRMQGRTGFHVLMGSAADAVSYEASQYGQGLLTYALLQGMKSGEALQEGQVDVTRLFQYVADRVPRVAENVGGVQRPEIRAPLADMRSFAFGLITDADKRDIPLAQVKPLLLRPRLQNRDLDYDNLELEALLREALREASYITTRGRDAATVVFVDADEMPDALRPSGSYVVADQVVTISLRLIRNNQPVSSVTVTGTVNDERSKNKLIQRLVRDIMAEAQKPSK